MEQASVIGTAPETRQLYENTWRSSCTRRQTHECSRFIQVVSLSEASINMISCKYRVIHILGSHLNGCVQNRHKKNKWTWGLPCKKIHSFWDHNWGIQHLCSPPMSHLFGMTPHPSAVISSVFEEDSVTKPLSCFYGSCSVCQFFVFVFVRLYLAALCM